MSIQLANIIIWQKNGHVRNLEIKKNAVNVITGDSGKGKSSILHIIDFCLLSSEAKGISKFNIDNKATWYGIRLHTSKGLITIARPAHHCDETTSAYLHDKGTIPEIPELNIRLISLKKIIDKELGLDSDLKVPFGGKTIKAGSKVSFRSFLAYCYQDQTALVAPDYLYIRPADLKFRERIERTFKMAIGIVDLKDSLIDEKVKSLTAKLESFKRKSELLANKSLEFEDDVLSLEEEAISLGLIDKVSSDVQSTLEKLNVIVHAPSDIFNNINTELKELELRRFEIYGKIKQFKKFNEEYIKYQKLLKDNTDSIKPVEYLFERYKDIIPGTKTLEVINALNSELEKVRINWVERKKSVLFVDVNEKEKLLQKELEDINEKIDRVRIHSNSLSSPEEIYKYQGRLSVKVELYSDKSQPIDYSEKITTVKHDIKALESQIQDMDSKREYVIGKLNRNINTHLSNLKLKGYESSEAVFLEKENVINLILDGGNAVEKMVDIGSASNYLYLHLAYFMALHEVAREQNVSWLPSFIVFDQVSTPYGGETEDDKNSLNIALIELNNFVENMKDKGGIQVILMEHIKETHWLELGLNNFSLVDKELIGDYGLIN
jgi:ABC-type iron transport system FetAB ATPase subunit